MSTWGHKVGQRFHLLCLAPVPPVPAGSLLQQSPGEGTERWPPHPGAGPACAWEGGGVGRGPAEPRGRNLLMRLPTDPELCASGRRGAL